MFENDDFTARQKYTLNGSILKQDLELNTLCNAMASGDVFVSKMVMDAILSGFSNDLNTILYRQDILKDTLENATVVRDIYKIAADAIGSRNKHWFFHSMLLHSSISNLKDLMGFLKQLKILADDNLSKFKSRGFTRFFGMIKKELDDEYITKVLNRLLELEFHDGILLNAGLGSGRYILREPFDKRQNWMQRLLTKKTTVYSFSIDPRDENSSSKLREIKEESTNVIAKTLAQSMEHIFSFFEMLRTEVAFYIGCLNLKEKLTLIGEQTSFPKPIEANLRVHSFTGLYDVCLALTMKQKIIRNDLTATNRNLFLITGANKGGKSTFLRGIGLAQMMMQCGMFAPADTFSANICDYLFTHFKREEDSTMTRGKLDEELNRMNRIADNITSNSMILFNESFAATNEREGSEIARQIVNALLEKRIKVFFVTHLFDFANSYYYKNRENAIFLRAERQTDGTRTFKLKEGEPLQTSYGEDLFNKIFKS